MYSRKRFFILFLLCMSAFGVLAPFVHAEETAEERKARLENDLATIEKQIQDQQTLLSSKQRESVSLERDVAILDAQIAKAKLEIRARDLAIQNLSGQIGEKGTQINQLSSKIDAEKTALATLVRKTSEIDTTNISALVLGNKDISEFVINSDSYSLLQEDLQNVLGQVTVTKQSTEEAKAALEDRKQEQLDLRHLQDVEQKRIAQQEAERKKILAESRGKEAEYKKVIASQEKDAAAIRAALFSLSGSAAIPFGKALEYANFASSKTGVRPALILGIITEETNLGENVGTGNWKVDMHPTRDVPIFAQICAKLGLDPDSQPVSKKAWYGWGGAMGPAQFIPSTWVLYEDRIAAVTGNSPANPWNPRDAFTATAILLKDNGALSGDISSERLAALRYLAGWKNASKSSYAFYGDDVIGFATKYEKQIKILSGN